MRYGAWVWAVTLGLSAVAGPLPLPAGEVTLVPLGPAGEVTAAAAVFGEEGPSEVYFIRPTGDDYGLFHVGSWSREPELLYSSPDLDPHVLAVGRDPGWTTWLAVGIRMGNTPAFIWAPSFPGRN